MIIPFALMLQAATQPVAANAQLVCTLAMPGAQPVTLSVDLKTQKPGVAAIVGAPNAPFSRISAASEAVRWPASGGIAFTFATGAGQYRMQLTGDPERGSAAARIVGLGQAATQPLFAQGFCTARPGKRLVVKNLARMAFDPTTRASPPITLRPLPIGIQGGTCRLIGPDRRTHMVSFAVLSANGNETTVSHRFDDPAWLGAPIGTGTGVQFHLASPPDHQVIRTVTLGGQPPLTVRTSFERSGTWIDVTRGGAVAAQGECGVAPPAILAPLAGK